MTTMNLPPVISGTFHKPMKALAVGALALGLCLFAGVDKVQATTYNWTNTTGAAFNDPNAWNIVGGPGGTADTANFTIGGTVTTFLSNNFANIGSIQFGGPAAGTGLNVSLNFGTNTFAGISGNSSSASGFVFGQLNGSTCAVTICVGTLYCTNAANTPSNARMIIGRNGAALVTITNGTVINGNLVMANSATATGSKLVLSGPNTSWSNQTTVSIANSVAFNNSLVISNSASMTVLSTFNVGSSAGSGGNSLLIDSGSLFTRNQDPSVGASGCSNNAATIQNSGLWDLGGRRLLVGNGGGVAVSNVLRISSSAIVSNVTFVILTAGNTLDLQGGTLRVSSSVTNSGTLSGFGTIVGNTVVTNGAVLAPGEGTSVGTLVFSNNFTLGPTATTVLKLDKSQTASNDLVVVAGTFSEGGTLTINNTGPALVGGDTFQIISGTQSSAFSFINLPPLAGTLVWNTSLLSSSGIISVVQPPTIVGPNPQAVFTNSTVVISTTVNGVPTPSLQWLYNGSTLTDGGTGNGSTITGSTTSGLTIQNAQIPDSGNYCLIASNTGGAVTNCMTLEVTATTAAPLIGGPTDQNVISPNSATFIANIAGIPTPTVQWQDNGANILNETNTTLVIPNVTFSLDGHVYSIIASNSVGTTTNSATLHVVVPPAITTQPVSLVVTQTQSATFSVLSTNGVPAPTYQWFFNNVAISGATSSSVTIASATPANDGNYKVTVANVVGSVTSSNATLTVNSTMSASLTPSNGATAVCYDTPLYLLFNRTPISTGVGKINIYDSTNSTTPVDTIDTSLGNIQARTIGTEIFNTFPIIITGNQVAVYPHLDLLSSNQTYFVTVDPGTFSETNGAFFAGITTSNAWQFATKSAPANPNNLVVATDGSGDFCTVQGAVDFVPTNNATKVLVNIHNGTYTEVVDTRNKNNITFRGQSRTGTIVGYQNNNNINGSTHSRMAFKIFANDLAVENMTVVNTTPQGGSQAEALMIDTGAARFILNNAEVDSRQDTILANVNSSQGYFFNSLVQGNFDYVWGGGNMFFTNCELRTIPTASNYNLAAPRTDNGATGNWLGPDGNFASNGISFVNCLLTRGSNNVTGITMSDGNGAADGVAAWINCNVDPAYTNPIASVVASQILWEFANSNLNNTASATFGLTVLTNGDARLIAASTSTIWLNGWSPQLAPNILTNPVSQTVTAGVSAAFNVTATGIPSPNYQWLKNGATITGATSASLTVSNAHCPDAGIYSVIVSNIAGSVTSSNATLTVIGSAPVASFTAAPTSGTEPLVVSFTDTSSSALSVLWNFGDLSTSNTAAGATVLHTYAAGTYTVSLTASNACDVSTLTSNNLINVFTAFQAWQIQYFGSTTNPAAAANADPDGDGQNNLAEFLAGTNPTNSASGLHITSVAQSGSDVVITWSTAGGASNIVQATPGDGNGGYATNFTDLSGTIVITGSGDATTNYTDVGGATNSPSRYYRVRLAP